MHTSKGINVEDGYPFISRSMVSLWHYVYINGFNVIIIIKKNDFKRLKTLLAT